MRTIHLGLRVTDARRSIAFYTAVGYEVVGRVADTPIGELTMLKLPADEFVTIELVHDPDATSGGPTSGGALSHLVIATDSMADTITNLNARGIDVEAPTSPDGSDELLTTMIVDPDGNRIEIVQWPAGHPAGFTVSDFRV
jgi:lactoylglutathione lyase